MTNPQNTQVANPIDLTTPEERNAIRFGFVPQAEIWNGRLAMLGFIIAVLIELFSGQGFLHFWGLI